MVTKAKTSAVESPPALRGRKPGLPVKLRPAEVQMLQEGRASIRMCAAKTSVHRSTWARLVKNDLVDYVFVCNIAYISIDSVKAYVGTQAVEMYNLDDWSDVAELLTNIKKLRE